MRIWNLLTRPLTERTEPRGRAQLLLEGGFSLIGFALFLVLGVFTVRGAETHELFLPAVGLLAAGFLAASAGAFLGYDAVVQGRRMTGGLTGMALLAGGGTLLLLASLPLLGGYLTVIDAPRIVAAAGAAEAPELGFALGRESDLLLIVGSLAVWAGLASLAASTRDDDLWPRWASRIVPILAGLPAGAMFVALLGTEAAFHLFGTATLFGCAAALLMGVIAFRAGRHLHRQEGEKPAGAPTPPGTASSP